MPLKILLVTDNAFCHAQLCKVLSAAGHQLASVPEGTDPVRAIRQQKPDLIVISVEADKIAGLAVEHRLHNLEGSRSVPVIVVSDCLMLEPELLHVFDFIPWPLDAARLLEDVAAIAAWYAAEPRVATPPALGDQQYRQLAGHILDSAGLHFETRNRSALERGVLRRMAVLRIDNCADYLAYLRRHGESRYELQKLLQLLTVGETYFFRYPSQFHALRDRLATGPSTTRRQIRIWSAGCSTGEEPYSIAISIIEALPEWREHDIRVIATDINHQSLAKARRGIYSQWSLRTTPLAHRERYFKRVGESYQIAEEVKSLVRFHHLNLSAVCAADFCEELCDLDAIFCRNVLIYFSQDSALRLIERFAAALKPAGQLFLGHSESLFQRVPALEVRRRDDSYFYVKTAEPRSAGGEPGDAAEVAGSWRAAADAEQVATELPPAVTVAPAPAAAPTTAPPRLDRREQAVPPAPPKAGPPTGDTAAKVASARRLFEAERLDDAFDLLQAVLADFPAETDALVLKGFILKAKGRLDEALDACCQAIGMNDLLPEAYFLKGTVLDACGRLAEAADEYRKALLLDHDFVMPRYHMWQLYLKLGRVPEAAREIRNSIKILAKAEGDDTIPYSGGLSRAVCLEQLQDVLTHGGLTGTDHRKR